VAFVIGMSARPVVGWRIDPSFGQGSQYVSIRFSERLTEAGIDTFVDSKGDSCDNALAEMVNWLYKAEVIHSRPWPTRESVELATVQPPQAARTHRLHPAWKS
jgi:transposase InsO family protein